MSILNDFAKILFFLIIKRSFEKKYGMLWTNLTKIERERESYSSICKVNIFIYFEFLFRYHFILFNCRIIASQLIISDEKIENKDLVCKANS